MWVLFMLTHSFLWFPGPQTCIDDIWSDSYVAHSGGGVVDSECGQSGPVSPPLGLIFWSDLYRSRVLPLSDRRYFWSALSNAESIHRTRVQSVRGSGKRLTSLRVGGCGEPLVLPSLDCGEPPSVRKAEGVRLGRPYIAAACAVVSYCTERVQWAGGAMACCATSCAIADCYQLRL
ncbi:hypothetical protein PoB_006581200 [Plakobranchus ocellatus]|uniref:Secreted protein n=1 Tax=Plakobranchus ocellatus TaxID=259542 RepID=A0AAV4D588_9GAST|nr:hypothetical protein PoB_006581200 [Plakobranchus ocellatus]